MTIHKEGYSFLTNLLLTLVVVNFIYAALVDSANQWKPVVPVLSVIVFFLFLQFFRKPGVKPQVDAGCILAPADGRIVVVEEVQENRFLKEPCTQISIFMSPVDVHSNRNPVSGVLRHYSYHPGKYLMAWNPKSSEENERTELVYETLEGRKLLVRQIAGFLARRIVCYISEGDTAAQGEEFGFIKFGSRLDVLVPAGSSVEVAVGARAKAGITVLARWT